MARARCSCGKETVFYAGPDGTPYAKCPHCDTGCIRAACSHCSATYEAAQ